MDFLHHLQALNREQLESFFAVDRRTLARWRAGRHRAPRAAAALARILARGELPFAGWESWRLARIGRAREYRLLAPDGTDYTAGEIAGLRALQCDYAYLISRVRALEASPTFSAAETATLAAAAAILRRKLGEQERPARRLLRAL